MNTLSTCYTRADVKATTPSVLSRKGLAALILQGDLRLAWVLIETSWGQPYDVTVVVHVMGSHLNEAIGRDAVSDIDQLLEREGTIGVIYRTSFQPPNPTLSPRRS